jgi:hypothetical protein
MQADRLSASTRCRSTQHGVARRMHLDVLTMACSACIDVQV